MNTIFYTPAVHTNEFKSKYILKEGEEVIDMIIQKNTVSTCYFYQWKGKQGHPIVVSQCMFFTNFGRIFYSQKNMESFEITEVLDDGYTRRTSEASIRWFYDENQLCIESSFEDESRAKYIFQQLETEPSSKLQVTILDTPIKIENKKSQKKSKEAIELQKRYQKLVKSIEDLYTNYIDLSETNKSIPIENMLESTLKKCKNLLQREDQIKTQEEDLNDWLIYKRVKQKLNK